MIWVRCNGWARLACGSDLPKVRSQGTRLHRVSCPVSWVWPVGSSRLSIPPTSGARLNPINNHHTQPVQNRAVLYPVIKQRTEPHFQLLPATKLNMYSTLLLTAVLNLYSTSFQRLPATVLRRPNGKKLNLIRCSTEVKLAAAIYFHIVCLRQVEEDHLTSCLKILSGWR